jgi:hypothetical protein
MLSTSEAGNSNKSFSKACKKQMEKQNYIITKII